MRCLNENHKQLLSPHDGVITQTYKEQNQVEITVERCFDAFKAEYISKDEEDQLSLPLLSRKKHKEWLLRSLRTLSSSYMCLDASQPWLCYWILNSLSLLDVQIPQVVSDQVANFLYQCQDAEGGFCGGPGQYPHLAPTYAAVNALCILGTEKAYDVINRKKLKKFLIKLHQPDGSFLMHDGGEVDVRGAYCAASAASLTNILSDEIFYNTAEWVSSCQSYEGGFGATPGVEAHGGYSFCAYACLMLLKKDYLCNKKRFLHWVAKSQMSYEGGFQGRTNKLVDGCYSFWQAGSFPLLHMSLLHDGDRCLAADKWMFDQAALQEYILLCCQHSLGGLIDKPGKSRDFYHTCYCLNGLSVAQHFDIGTSIRKNVIVGEVTNSLRSINPLYGVEQSKVKDAEFHFKSFSSDCINRTDS